MMIALQIIFCLSVFLVRAQDFFVGGISDECISDKFISRVAFQKLCAFAYDTYHTVETSPTVYTPGGVTFDPKLVKAGDLVFVRQVDQYFADIHPHITVPYMILTHGDCRDEFKEDYLEYLKDEKIIAWFAAHCLISDHPKLYQLPLGVVQHKYYYDDRARINALFTHARKNAKMRTNALIYINYIFAHPERRLAFDYFLDKPFATYGGKKPFEEFVDEMAQHKFTLSPRGAGPDSYRTWEALLVGSIPIVQSSALNPLYKDLPILIINDWSELTEPYLNRKYAEITSKKYSIEKMYIEYWAAMINSVRDAYFAHILKCH